MKRPWYAIVFLVFLLFACFQAWEDQYLSMRGREADLFRVNAEKANLEGQLSQVQQQVKDLEGKLAAAGSTGNRSIIRPQLPTAPGSPESPPQLLSMKIVSQERYASTIETLPFALKVIVQTNMVVDPVSLLFTCNGEVGQMDFEFAGGGGMRLWNDKSGMLKDKRTFLISFEGQPFTPEKPLLLYLHSKEAVRVIKMEQPH